MSLEARVAEAIASAGLPAAEILLDPPRHPGLGDLATPVAMGIAKATGRNPLAVAEAIAAHLDGASAAAPGFINWRLPDAWISTAALATLSSAGAPPYPDGLDALEDARARAMGGPAGPVRVIQAGKPIEARWSDLSAALDPATAWFWLQLKPAGTPLEIDLDIASSQTVENPAYYVRYSLERAKSIVAKAASEGLTPTYGPVEPAGRALAVSLLRWPDELRRQPQRRVRFLRELADAFHAYYATQRVFGAPEASSRLGLVDGTGRVLRVVLEEGLGIPAC